MSSDTGSTTVVPHITPPAPDVIPDAPAGPMSDRPPVASPNDAARADETVAAANATETPAELVSRMALRARLHGYAIATVALFAVLIALAASNTARVKVNWLFGSSDVSLVWLVLVTAIVAWLLGLVASTRFNWRTRAPRRQRGAKS